MTAHQLRYVLLEVVAVANSVGAGPSLTITGAPATSPTVKLEFTGATFGAINNDWC